MSEIRPKKGILGAASFKKDNPTEPLEFKIEIMEMITELFPGNSKFFAYTREQMEKMSCEQLKDMFETMEKKYRNRG
jgi:hypothetical protein